jgi:hypothetical protein
MTEEPLASEPRPSSGCVRWLAIILLVFSLVAGVLTWKFYGLLKEGVAWLKDLPGRMVTQTLTESFRESVTKISSTNGDILEVAILEQDETFLKYDMKTLFNEMIYLGTTTSEIRVPVVYRYHIKLTDDWQLKVDGKRCIVHAPGMRPSLPPAIRTEGMQKKSETGWFRFNAEENLAALEKSLTPSMEKRAGNRSHLDKVRDASRKSVGEFVKKWLLTEGQAASGEIDSIIIIFPDEAGKDGEPPASIPALPVHVP